MKKIINKTVLAIILALSMVLALFGGVLFAKQTISADAAGSTTVKLTADTTSFTPGSTFKLTITISTTEVSNYKTVTLRIGPKATESDVNIDLDKAAMLTFSNLQCSDLLKDTFNSSKVQKESSYANNGMVQISFGAMTDDQISTAEDFVAATVDVTINKDLKISEMADINFLIGVKNQSACCVAYENGVTYRTTDTLKVENLTFALKEPSDNNNLASLKVGQGENETDLQSIDLTDNSLDIGNIKVVVTDPSLPLSVLPVTEDGGAKVKLMPGDIAVKSGEIGTIDIPDDGEVTIVVTSEKNTVKEYKLKITVVGAMLTDLTVSTDTQTTGLMKEGLKETFASSTVEYTVYVPSDATKVTFNAKVSTGHNELTTLDLTANGFTAPETATSGVDFEASDIKDGKILTITCKASKGSTNSSKDYKITFAVVDVDATLKSVEVKGTNNTVFTNSELKAQENGADYYYLLVGCTSGIVTPKANSEKAVINLAGTEISATTTSKTLTEGSYQITVTAEAGNTKVYTIKLKNYSPIELVDGSTFDFLLEEASGSVFFRRSYKEKGMKHGVDDVNLEMFVVGQIEECLSANELLANFKNMTGIKLYNNEGLMYDCGSVGDGFTDDDLDDATSYAVGTGWYIEYYVGNELQETVYVSVLGDLDGNGYNTSEDISCISLYILDELEFNLYERLAARIVNESGEITAEDISAISDYIKGEKMLNEYFYQAE